MDELRQLSELIGRIYDAAVDPIVWPEVVERTAVWLDAPMGLLMTPFNPPSTGGYVLPFGIDQAGLELWRARYVGTPLVGAPEWWPWAPTRGAPTTAIATRLK